VIPKAGLNPFCGGTLGVAVVGKAQQGRDLNRGPLAILSLTGGHLGGADPSYNPYGRSQK
jgi:hypothetical protein